MDKPDGADAWTPVMSSMRFEFCRGGGTRCRHSIGYWQRVNYLGLGIRAASLMENIRYTNVSNLYQYLERTAHIKEELGNCGYGDRDSADRPQRGGSEQDIPATNLHETTESLSRRAQMEEFMFLGLRMTGGVSRERFAQNFGVEIEAVYQEVSQSLQGGASGKHAGQIYLTKRGQEAAGNYVLAQFLLM